MAKELEKEDLRVYEKDFSLRWHLSLVGILTLLLVLAYFLAIKLFLN